MVGKLFKRPRRWIISLLRTLARALEDTEDDPTEDLDEVVPLPPGTPAWARLLITNHLHHLRLDQRAQAIRIGRLEAKMGIIMAGVIAIASAAILPWWGTIVQMIF